MTRKSDPAVKPARKTSARRSRAATTLVTAPTPAVAPSTLRRDLGRQASRFALLTAMTLAAGATLAPGEARADCTVNVVNVQCGTTTTTNTNLGTNPPNDRNYVTNGFIGMALTVQQGAVVNGAGLAVTDNGSGGLNVVNNGSIRVDGPVPTVGGTGALSLSSSGGITYSGNGSITNTRNGSGLEVVQGGAGNTDIVLGGAVSAASGVGIDVRDTTAGGSIDIVADNVTASAEGVLVISSSLNGDIDLTVNGDIQAGATGIVVAQGNSAATGDIRVDSRGDITAGGRGISISSVGSGTVGVTAGGIVAADDGINVQGRDAVAVIFDGPVTSDNRGVVVSGGTGGAGGILVAGSSGITAVGTGVSVRNNGAGQVTIDVGDIVAGDIGVSVRDTALGGAIFIDTGNVTAEATGIDVVTANRGHNVNIAVDGDVRSTINGLGVSVVTTDANSTNDVTIEVSGSASGTTGVYVSNAGAGNTVIDVDGDVTGATGSGIEARGRGAIFVEVEGLVTSAASGVVMSGGSAGGNLVLNGGADITAVDNGVNIQNNGTGDVTVDVGNIVAGGSGVYVRDQAGGGDIAVRTGSIASGAAGVNVVTASGSGNVFVETEGAVTSQVGPGIIAAALGAGSTSNVDVIARAGVSGETGISVLNEGTGDIRVNATGPVVGRNGDGVYVDGRAELNIFLTDSVTGAANGVYARAHGAAAGGLNVAGGADIVAQAGDGLVLINDGAGEVFVNVGDITATGGDGVQLSDTAQGGDIDITTGAVTALDGIGLLVISESDTADISLVANGDVRGGTDGILAGHFNNDDATGDVSVTVNGDVSGESGATVITRGSGDVSFTATGTVTSSLNNAVNVGTAGSGDVNVRVGSVDGAQIGISAGSNGGDVAVIATGSVTARDGDGVTVFSDVAGDILIDVAGPVSATNGSGVRASGVGAISITTGAVTADEHGIEADSDSETDDIVIVANGDVLAGDGYYGIDVEMDDGDAEGDIDITTRGAVEGNVGVYAAHDGRGDIRIRADGDVTGRVYEGIYAVGQNGASVEVGGMVTGEGIGIRVDAGGNGGDISVTGTGGAISNTSNAVDVTNRGSGTTIVDLSGDIRADAGVGVRVNDTASGGDIEVVTGNVSGRDAAIFVNSNSLQGDIDITANGDLSSPNFGVVADLNDAAATGDIRVHTRGAIRGGTGVFARNNGSGDIAVTADGDIDGGGAAYGVYASGQASVSVALAGDIGNVRRGVTMVGGVSGTGDVSLTGSGSVSGVDAGVEVSNQGSGATIVDLTGAVSTSAGDAVRVENTSTDGGDIRVALGDVTASDDGVIVTSASEFTNIDIDVRGDVETRNVGVVAILSNADAVGDIDITTRGAINAFRGIAVEHAGTGDIAINAQGDIITSGSGIEAYGRGAVTVGIAGVVDAGTGGVSIYGGLATDGDIVVSGVGGVIARDGTGIGINNAGDGQVIIDLAGPITAVNGDGLSITSDDDNGGDVDVHVGSVTALDGDGVHVTYGSPDADIRITTDGAITAGDYGALAFLANDDATGDITVQTNGTVSGADGVFVANAGSGDISIRTSGAVSGADGYGVYANGHGDIDIVANGAVDGEFGGILVETDTDTTGDITVTGTGAVTSRDGPGAGILNAGTGSVVYDLSGPVIAGGTGAGGVVVVSDSTDSGDVTVTTGSVQAASDYGVLIVQNSLTGDATVTSNGDVSGDIGGIAAFVTDNAATGNVAITANAVARGETGIIAQNNGAGDVTIAANGAVTGTSDQGILAIAETGAIDVSVAGSVTGNTEGALVQGEGNLSVTGTGPITGRDGDAVQVRSGGGGRVLVNLLGTLDATNGDGVTVRDTEDGGDIIVATGEVRAAGSGSRGVDVISQSESANVSVSTRGRVLLTGDGVGVAAMLDSATAIGNVSVTTRDTISAALGIVAQTDGSGTVSVDAQGAIVSAGDGVFAASNGGDVTVRAASVVSSQGTSNGIAAQILNAAGDGDISVEAGNVSGGRGILANNQGSGDTRIAATGSVTGTTGHAIAAVGLGDISVAVAGPVTGALGGVAIQGGNNGGDLSVTGAGAVTGRDDDAVSVQNEGSGTVTVNLTGALSATNGFGVRVRDTADGGDIEVATGAITAGGAAGLRGVDVTSQSRTADINVATRGAVTVGGTGTGVLAALASLDAVGDVRVNTEAAVTAETGIQAVNVGTGAVSVTANGPVTASANGIVAASNGGDVTVQAGTVTSTGDLFTGIWAENENTTRDGDVSVEATNVTASRGIYARNQGTGQTRVVTSGTVTATYAGVVAIAGEDADDVTVDVRNVTGAIGVFTDNGGVGQTRITTRGDIQGSTAAVVAMSSDDQDVTLDNRGTIRNTSGLASDTAIVIGGGGFAQLSNSGTIIGELDLDADGSAFDNSGLWTTAGGTSAFRGADDRLTNASGGSIVAGLVAGTAEVANWAGLEQFRNAGRLSMGDGGAGDVVATSANSVYAAGSTLQLDISGQALADLFFTTGTLAIKAGARLDVNFVQPLALNSRYTIVRAEGGLTGTFDFEDRLISAFVGLRDGYTATTAYIDVAQIRALAEAALTRNQRETATGVDSLPVGNALKDAVLVLPSDAVARDAFDQLSGEIHPAVRRAMVDDSALAREAVLDRLVDDPADSRIWGQVMMAERKTDGDENAAQFKNDARGLLFGAEQRQLGDTVTVGLAGGWFVTDMNLLERASKGRTETTQVLAYLGARMDRWGLRTGVGYARTSTETQREIAFPGFTASPAADYDGSVLQVFVDGGYRLPLHGGYVEPFANVTMVSAETGAFTETDGAQASLSGELKSDDVLITTLGARFETGRESDFSLRGMAGWRGMSGDLEPIGRHAFAGGETFSVLGPLHSDIGAVANLEGLWRVSPNFSVSAGYDAVFGSEGEDHTVSARLKVAF